MGVKTCKNCKHWYTSDNLKNDGDGWIRNPLVGDYGICQKANDIDAHGVQMLAVCDGEGIMGELIVHENFSCILFEEKDGNKEHQKTVD